MALFPLSLVGLYLFGDQAAAAVVLLVLTGVAIGSSIPLLSNRVMRIAPGSTEIAGAGNAVAFNVGIGLGSALGAATVARAGIRDTALTGTVLATLGLLVAVFSVARYAVARADQSGV